MAHGQKFISIYICQCEFLSANANHKKHLGMGTEALINLMVRIFCCTLNLNIISYVTPISLISSAAQLDITLSLVQ